MRAQLLPLDGGEPVEITKDLVVVGRKDECDLRLDHKSVSKMHCVLVKTDGLLLLRDLGSTNGTRVNGTRVRRAALLPNDQLTIANYKFRVYLGPDEPAASHRSELDQTQRVEPGDAAMLRKLREKSTADEGDEPSIRPAAARPVHRNQLPDVYVEDSPQSLSG
jgi:pSer/pThr/pTyr-binding forkhead associated (FHA) protein